MPIYIGATLGLVAGVVTTAYKAIVTARDTRSVTRTMDVVQSSISGYSFIDRNWKPERMTYTIPTVTGVAESYVMSKAGANKFLPAGVEY